MEIEDDPVFGILSFAFQPLFTANGVEFSNLPGFSRSDLVKALEARSPAGTYAKALKFLRFSFRFSPEVIALLGGTPAEIDPNMAVQSRFVLLMYVAWQMAPSLVYAPILLNALRRILESPHRSYAVRAIRDVLGHYFLQTSVMDFSAVFPVFEQFFRLTKPVLELQEFLGGFLRTLERPSAEFDAYLQFLTNFVQDYAPALEVGTITNLLYGLTASILNLERAALKLFAILAPHAGPSVVLTIAAALPSSLAKSIEMHPSGHQLPPLPAAPASPPLPLHNCRFPALRSTFR
jgi:hypothetical protein